MGLCLSPFLLSFFLKPPGAPPAFFGLCEPLDWTARLTYRAVLFSFAFSFFPSGSPFQRRSPKSSSQGRPWILRTRLAGVHVETSFWLSYATPVCFLLGSLPFLLKKVSAADAPTKLLSGPLSFSFLHMFLYALFPRFPSPSEGSAEPTRHFLAAVFFLNFPTPPFSFSRFPE